MSQIIILPEIISNKIAAGEVIDRPSSVTKELVENSIDAGSTKIIVEIKQGGLSLIRVTDNGTGMNEENALLSLERHATSKIRHSEDLFSIKTLGFRGEAIPSIASISKFTIITRQEQYTVGSKIEVIGGKIHRVSSYGSPIGVMITVKDLFFNTPVRKKFLKSVKSEISYIADMLSSMALAKPSIRFKLIHNSKTIKNWPISRNKFSRVNNILGNNITKQLLKVESESEDSSIKGWIVNPSMTRSTSRSIYFFVNNRYIKNKIIHHSLISAYKGRIKKGKYPIAILFINLPYNQVDVNVHPRKAEVRFLNPEKVHQFIYISINNTLKKLDSLKWDYLLNNNMSDTNRFYSKNKTSAYCYKNASGDNNNPAFIYNFNKKETLKVKHLENIDKNLMPKKTYLQPILWKEKKFSDLRVIGQHYNTYIICELTETLIIIDQHAAHERIVFEKLELNLNKDNSTFQKLLVPEIVEMTFTETKILQNLIPNLKRYGLSIEPFGGNTFIVKSIPKLIDIKKISTILTEIVEKTADIGINLNFKTLIYDYLAIMACHNSIKAKQSLNDQEIKTMLKELDNCNNPSYCPHGRPIWIEFTQKDLGNKFGRT